MVNLVNATVNSCVVARSQEPPENNKALLRF